MKCSGRLILLLVDVDLLVLPPTGPVRDPVVDGVCETEGPRRRRKCKFEQSSSISQRGLRYNGQVGSGCKRLSNSGDCTETGRLGRDDCDPGGGGLVQMRATKPHGHVCKQPMQKGPCLNLHGSHSCSTVVLIGITCPAITAGTVILRAGGKGA